MTEPGGTVSFLNGTSSAGKSSVARELQLILERPFAVFGSDSYRRMWSSRSPKDAIEAQAARTGFHRCIAALASAGNNVIVDSIHRSDEHRAEGAALHHSLPAYFAGVYCPLHIAEQREQVRWDRRAGLARSQFHEVHAHGVYDIEVDASVVSPTSAPAISNGASNTAQGPPPARSCIVHFSECGRKVGRFAFPADANPQPVIAAMTALYPIADLSLEEPDLKKIIREIYRRGSAA